MYRGIYKTANEALQLGMYNPKYQSRPTVNNYIRNKNTGNSYLTQFKVSQPIRENFDYTSLNVPLPVSGTKQPIVTTSETTDLGDPNIWGPSFWFVLHNGAAHYPIKATTITAERMKNFINGMPVMLPCTICSEHATTFIDKKISEDKIDEIVSGRENLFSFFWEFHNHVNVQSKKPIMTLDEAKKLYFYKS